MRRRTFAIALGGAVTGRLAGCLGGGAPDPELPAPVVGDPDAPVLVQSWEDFRCPHCRTFHLETLPRIVSEYVEPGRARFERHDFPIPLDEWSWSLAGAARSVQARQGDPGFFTFADYVYEHQSEARVGIVRAGASEAGADPGAVRSEMEDGAYRHVVEADRQLGADRGVDATPAVFVDGEPVPNGYSEVASAIEDA